MSDPLKRLDYAVYRTERLLVVVALFLMAFVVFLDVVHRGFAGEASKFAEVGIKVAGLFGSLPAKDAPEYGPAAAALTTKLAAVSPYFLFVVFSALGYFGIRSTKRSTPVPAPMAAVYAVAGVVATYGLIRLLLWVMPNGLIWSQPMALVLTLWVGFVGASMCTYERKHLKVEAVERYIPARYKPVVGFVSGLMTTTVCLMLAWVSLRYVRFNYEEFVQTEGRGGLVQGWDVPKYQAFAALPIAFFIMSVRFGVRAVRALQGHIEAPGDTLGLAGRGDGGGPALPSDIETEVIRAAASARRPSADAAPSEVDTMTSQPLKSDVVAPQSRVTTDPHQLARRSAQDVARDAAAPRRGNGPEPAAGRIGDSDSDSNDGDDAEPSSEEGTS